MSWCLKGALAICLERTEREEEKLQIRPCLIFWFAVAIKQHRGATRPGQPTGVRGHFPPLPATSWAVTVGSPDEISSVCCVQGLLAVQTAESTDSHSFIDVAATILNQQLQE